MKFEPFEDHGVPLVALKINRIVELENGVRLIRTYCSTSLSEIESNAFVHRLNVGQTYLLIPFWKKYGALGKAVYRFQRKEKEVNVWRRISPSKDESGWEYMGEIKVP